MPPKVKTTKEDIIKAAISLIREGGWEAVNARALALSLGCSTQPIFSNFSTMEELEKEARKEAYSIYLSFLEREAEEGKYPRYKSFGMAYTRFAREEKELFKLLFMSDIKGEVSPSAPDFTESVNMIMSSNGISRECAERFHLEMWICVHGIGAMLATSFLSFEPEEISGILSDVYEGLRAKHTGGTNGCN